MGLFGFGKAKQEKRLADAIAYNAEMIQRTEGKSRADAEYLSICGFLDDLRNRTNGREGWQATMAIAQKNYPEHFSDVMTYAGWSSGMLHLTPEAEAALRKRHAKGNPT